MEPENVRMSTTSSHWQQDNEVSEDEPFNIFENQQNYFKPQHVQSAHYSYKYSNNFREWKLDRLDRISPKVLKRWQDDQLKKKSKIYL